MNYELHYTKLIDRAKNRKLLPEQYKEHHHIVPRCLNGTDDIINLVFLTPEEHFLAHQLLVKIYPNNDKLVFAARMMCVTNGSQVRNNKEFGWLRRKASIALSNLHSGKILSEEHIQAIRDANTGENNYMYGKKWDDFYGIDESTRRKQIISVLSKERNTGKNNPMFGKTWEERYGIEDSARRKKEQSDRFIGTIPYNKDKTLEEVLGSDRAKEIKFKMSVAKKDKTWDEMYSSETIKLKLEILSERINGKTWEEIHGEKKASEMRALAKLSKSDATKLKMSEARTLYWKNKKINNFSQS